MCEYPAIYESRITKARKAHFCCECRMPIWKGQKYERVRSLFDGGWQNFKTCLHCVALIEECNETARYCDERVSHSQLGEWLYDTDYLKDVSIEDRRTLPFLIERSSSTLKSYAFKQIGKVKIFTHVF